MEPIFDHEKLDVYGLELQLNESPRPIESVLAKSYWLESMDFSAEDLANE
jgi:hypothetical protein